jgi:hypothetical protein
VRAEFDAGGAHGHTDRQKQAGRQADRQTDITKLNVAFRNFSNAPKNRDPVCIYSFFQLSGTRAELKCNLVWGTATLEAYSALTINEKYPI